MYPFVMLYLLLAIFIAIKIIYSGFYKTNINSLSYLNNYFQQVYVITLDNRKNYIQNIMHDINLQCIYFPAILKKNINKNKLIKSGFLSAKNKLNNGQIACHLSHIAVLKKFLNSNAQNCLIFEDDLKTPESNNTYLQKSLSLIPSNYDIIYLGRCWDRCKKSIPINDFIVKCFTPQCRHAYGVSRKGAQKIIKLTRPLIKAGDFTISRQIAKGNIIAYSPKLSIFFQNRENLSSNLGNIYKQKVCV